MRTKRCFACARSHSPESWSSLPLVGYMPNGHDGAGELLELRHCRCHSTLAIDLGDQPDSMSNVKIEPSSPPAR